MSNNGEFTLKRDTPIKPVKGRKSQEENANDFCTLCGANLELKFGKYVTFRKLHFQAENVFLKTFRSREV